MLLIINHKQCNPREKVMQGQSLAFTHEEYTDSNANFMSSTHFNLFADKCSVFMCLFLYVVFQCALSSDLLYIHIVTYATLDQSNHTP
jgi:hypothetical protein